MGVETMSFVGDTLLSGGLNISDEKVNVIWDAATAACLHG